VNQKAQRAAQQNDRADSSHFPKIPRDDRAQDFAAELELKPQRQRARQIEPDIDGLAGKIPDKIPRCAKKDDDDAHRFKQMDDRRNGGVKELLNIPVPPDLCSMREKAARY